MEETKRKKHCRSYLRFLQNHIWVECLWKWIHCRNLFCLRTHWTDIIISNVICCAWFSVVCITTLNGGFTLDKFIFLVMKFYVFILFWGDAMRAYFFQHSFHLTLLCWVDCLTDEIIYSLFHIFAVFWMLYAYFWVIPRRLNFMCWRFGTLCLFHLHRQVGVIGILHTYLPMKMEQSVPKRWHIKFRHWGIT